MDNIKYICKYCGKEFDSPYKLGGHIIHCNSNPNKAKSNFIVYNEKLKNGEIINKFQNELLYCQYCGKECKNSNSLKNHEIRCKCNPNRIIITSYFNEYNEKLKSGEIIKKYSNHYDKANKLGLPKPKISQETSVKLSNVNKNKKRTNETKMKISNAMKQIVKDKPDVYCGQHINGRVKKYEYNGIHLDGTWEVIVAQYLDKNNIKWQRPHNSFEYIWENDVHSYYPDFYLPDYEYYIEVKGYETERDLIKYTTINKLIVLKKKEINSIINNNFNIFDYINTI